MRCSRPRLARALCWTAAALYVTAGPGCAPRVDAPAARPAHPAPTTRPAPRSRPTQPAAVRFEPDERHNLTFRTVSLELERQPDGKKYTSYLKERYELSRDGWLDYSGYFGGMPLSMNHNDSTRWHSGLHGRAVIVVVQAFFIDPALFAALLRIPDEGESSCTPGAYRIGLTRGDVDLDCCLKDRKARAFKLLDNAFQGLIAEFERSAGRPLTPSKLPQHSVP